MNIENNPYEIEGHFAAIVESSDDAIVGKTLDGIITSWNPAAERIFGYSRDEAVGQHITLIIPEHKRDEEFVIIGKVKAGERVEHFETVRRRKDGSPVEISLTVSPIKNRDGKIVGASKIARDVSQQKIAERSSAYLAAIVDSSDDVIVSKDLNSIVTSWNASAERVFGYTAEEMIGQSIIKLIPTENIDEEYTILGKIKAGQRVDHFETVRRVKNGTLINVSITVSPIRDGKGNIVGASKVARDITEQKRTENALREAGRQKDEFLANISHELRTPMNAIIGLTGILQMSQHLQGKEQQYLDTIKSSADGLMRLLNGLLDYAKLGSDAFTIENIEFDLTEVVANAANVVSVEAKGKQLPVRTTYGPSLRKHYMGDPLRLQQVLLNLLANAVKFTEQGSVEINVHGTESDDENRTTLRIEVKDTGIGIAEDKLAVIFEKFTQADASVTRRFGGTGLGLSLSKGIVEKMGGTISVQSRVGLGTTFVIDLPLKNGPSDAIIENTADTFERGKKNVLIVDDYEPNLLVLTATLDMSGYDYDAASNGLEALRKVKRNGYDVILMDVQMPEMDGFESTRRIRTFEQEHELPEAHIIAMTAHVQERDKHRCLEAGMNEFVAKPFDPAALMRTLANLIGR